MLREYILSIYSLKVWICRSYRGTLITYTNVLLENEMCIKLKVHRYCNSV